MNFTTPEQEYLYLYKRMAQLCKEQSWGDPFSYARSKEIYAAIKLGHTVAPTLSGADGYDSNGNPLEYKSTIAKYCKGSYTGISVQPTWELQDKYHREDKILPYHQHYYNRFENGELAESWMIPGKKVYDILTPKLRKKYPSVLKKKDPRLSANITCREIKKHGTKII
tara:strand:+ start:719 stop:1222 length:504 start_codon:yes stop_codon:yes gene_type:complete